MEDGSGLVEGDDGDPRTRACRSSSDAELKIRSRLFLEGNYFVDLAAGHARLRRSSRTAAPSRRTRRPRRCSSARCSPRCRPRRARTCARFLREYSLSLKREGARGLQRGDQALGGRVPQHLAGQRRHARPASRTTSTACSRARRRVFGALSEDEEALKDLVTDLNRTVAAFARQEDNLKAAIPRAARRVPRGAPGAGLARTARCPRSAALRATRCPARARPRPPSTRRSRSSARRARLVSRGRAGRALARAAPGGARARAAEHAARRARSRRTARSPPARTSVLRALREDADPGPRLPLPERRALVRGVRPRRSSASRARAASPTPTRPSSARRPGGGPTTAGVHGRAGEQLFGQLTAAAQRAFARRGPAKRPELPARRAL